jgi:hypothetical protein
VFSLWFDTFHDQFLDFSNPRPISGRVLACHLSVPALGLLESSALRLTTGSNLQHLLVSLVEAWMNLSAVAPKHETLTIDLVTIFASKGFLVRSHASLFGARGRYLFN